LKNPKIAESLPPLLMERAGERRIKQQAFIDSPHPTLSRWRGMLYFALNNYVIFL